MECRLVQWTSKGGQIAFLTLTQAHRRQDALDVLWARLEHGWQAVTTGRAWERDKARYGIRGFQRVTEIVHSHNGWNPHYHVILLIDRAPARDDLDPMLTALATRFMRGVRDGGGDAELSGQHLRFASSHSLGELSRYCFKGLTVQQSSQGARTPMAVLNDLEATGKGVDLWIEFNDATHRGRRQVSVSRGIDKVCAAGPLP